MEEPVSVEGVVLGDEQPLCFYDPERDINYLVRVVGNHSADIDPVLVHIVEPLRFNLENEDYRSGQTRRIFRDFLGDLEK